MSDDMTPTSSGEPQPTPPTTDTSDIANQLREMSVQFEAMFRAAVESERARQLRRDLSGGMQELTSQIQTALKTLQTSTMAQQAEERGRQLVEQAQQSKFVQDLQETVVSGVGQLNERLRQFVSQIEQQNAGPRASNAAQQVPIETEITVTDVEPPFAPVTDETRRLDDEIL